MALITISYSMGTDGLGIARRVAEELKLALYDDQKLQEEIRRLGIDHGESLILDQKEPGFFDRLLSRKPDIYLGYMESVVYSVAEKGEGVIVGHGSQTLLQDFSCAMHVLVHSRRGSRVQHLVKAEGLSEEAAEKLIQKSDATQQGFFRYAFQKEWDDPSLYDLIINTEKMGGKTAARLIVGSARSDEMTACSLAAVGAMKRLGLAKKIEAELLKNDIYLHNLNIDVLEGNVVDITGVTLTRERKERVQKVVSGVPGVTRVNLSVYVRSSNW